MAVAAVDLRDILFARLEDKTFRARVTTESPGVVSGSAYARSKLAEHGLSIEFLIEDGARVCRGDLIAKISGSAKQITMAEEYIIGDMAKVSGIATAADRAVRFAGATCRVASGSWKKMPAEIKQAVRDAIVAGGASPRLVDAPFVYLDKNYVRIFGSLSAALDAASPLEGHVKVIQLKGETGSIEAETRESVASGADVIMVDTGSFEDVSAASAVLEELGVRSRIRLAFAKDLKLEDIPKCVARGIDLLCIGKEIIDAPLMDMKLDIVRYAEE